MLKERTYEFNVLESKNLPFRHFLITDIFSDKVNGELLAWLNGKLDWEYTETSFYTQYEFSLIHTKLPPRLTFLTSGMMVKSLAKCFNHIMQSEELTLVGITAHKLVNGYRMGVHNDYIDGEETHRLVVQINSDWREDNGGYLMLLNSRNPEDISTVIRPVNNTAIGFEISKDSFHAVSTVYDFDRYTLVYTFRASNGKPE